MGNFLQRVLQSRKGRAQAAASALADVMSLEKAFDTEDFGAVKPRGGAEKHAANRLDLFLRVVNKFDCLADEQILNIKRTYRKIDEHGRLSHGVRWGFMFRDEMKQLLTQFDKKNMKALEKWLSHYERRIPPPAIKA